MSLDRRGWRIALIADALLNPEAGASAPDVITVLEASGYGVLHLPPTGSGHGLLLAVTADQVAEYVDPPAREVGADDIGAERAGRVHR